MILANYLTIGIVLIVAWGLIASVYGFCVAVKDIVNFYRTGE